MSNRRNGGIIGPQTRTTFSSAPGVWHLDDAQQSSGAKNWPGGPAAPYVVTYLAVAGGGGGGYNDGGGGGAGGLTTSSITATPGSTYTITVGAAGSGSAQTGNNSSSGSIGSNSVITNSATTITAVGGGAGGALTNSAIAGGSGGGAGSFLYSAGSGTSLQGSAGGSGGNVSIGYYVGGGGGGAGAVGNNASSTPGSGGIGIASTITGSSVYYAGGGGGSGDNRTTTGSITFNGTSDYIYSTSSSYSFGTGDFTIEFWHYPSGSVSNNGLFQLTNAIFSVATLGISVAYLGALGAGTIQVSYGSNSTVTVTPTFSTSAWNHFALVRSSNTLKLYVNGVGSTIAASDTTNYSYQGLAIAGYYATSQLTKGNFSNFRIVKGTAIYTSNFTPPTSPLPVVAGTSLLTSLGTGFFDASGNNNTISIAGSPYNTTSSPFTTVTANIAGASGGNGGGGTGGGNNGNATTGSANTGGGGGGGAFSSNIAAAGGSGVVILSIPTVNYTGLVTGSPTVTTSGANTVVQFNGNGTYVA
jgi:Concanavalin A-like lectin/glucanases superfamily